MAASSAPSTPASCTSPVAGSTALVVQAPFSRQPVPAADALASANSSAVGSTISSTSARTLSVRPPAAPAPSPRQRSPEPRQPVVQFNERVSTLGPDDRRGGTDRRRPSRSSTGGGGGGSQLSSNDQAWGELFYSKGYPTTRAHDVLRGLANFIVRVMCPLLSVLGPCLF